MLTIILTGDAIKDALLNYIENEGISLQDKHVDISIISKRSDKGGIEATINITDVDVDAIAEGTIPVEPTASGGTEVTKSLFNDEGEE